MDKQSFIEATMRQTGLPESLCAEAVAIADPLFEEILALIGTRLELDKADEVQDATSLAIVVLAGLLRAHIDSVKPALSLIIQMLQMIHHEAA